MGLEAVASSLRGIAAKTVRSSCTMLVNRKHRLARIWSNSELRKVAGLFTGSVVNVSAWDDRDKQGSYYRNYFFSAAEYRCTNYDGVKGFQGLAGEINLDLTEELPAELEKRFDVVFNHTTLEHIFDVRRAVGNLCAMSRDVVIVVVPFAQHQHETESYGDFWRFAPGSLRYLFREYGYQVVYEAASNYKNSAVYLFFVGARDPAKWQHLFPHYEPVREAGKSIGDSTAYNISVRGRRMVSRLLRVLRLKRPRMN